MPTYDDSFDRATWDAKPEVKDKEQHEQLMKRWWQIKRGLWKEDWSKISIMATKKQAVHRRDIKEKIDGKKNLNP